MIGKKLAHYEILEKIGAGGMGEVFRARDTKLGRDVAIKVLPQDLAVDPERRARFEREARSIAALKHPNIVTIYSVEEAEGHLLLIMELVEGKSLSDLLPKGGLSLSRFFEIAIPVSEAIHAAHIAGITHRDLKPANIMIDDHGRVKVLDFGLAKLLSADLAAPEDKTVAADVDTQEGKVLGTVPYMSPEQAEAKPVDHRSDIFTLGIVLYEMATGERPFKGDSNLSIMSKILRDTPSTITDVRGHLPVQLGRIVQHCLEKDPRRRFQSALDIANELEALRTEVSTATGSVTAIRAVRRPLLNKKVGVAGAVVFVVILAALIFSRFSVEITPDRTAEAGGNNTLAVMYFDNLNDPDDPKRYGEIVGELLITGLSESEHLQVVSSQRLYDILKLLGKEGEKTIDRSTATEIAERSNARWMMQGRILQTDPGFVITSQIVEVESGNVAASQRITGQPGESIFALVDRIAEETLQDLSVPADAAPAAAPGVASMATSSEEAYRRYLEGVELSRKLFTQEARQSFRKVVALDSTFAMAHYHLAQVAATEEELRLARLSAIRHAKNATAKEQLYIEALRAQQESDPRLFKEAAMKLVDAYPEDKIALTTAADYYQALEGDYAAAAEYVNRVIDIDPLAKLAYNRLAYLYQSLNEFDKSIWAINKYIELAPDEPNPYDTRGDLYAANGRVDEAIESYARSVTIKPDFAEYASVLKLGNMYLFKGNYDKAAEEYRRMFNSQNPTTRARARRRLAALPAARGHLRESIRRVEAAMATDMNEGFKDLQDSHWKSKSMLLSRLGDDAGALAAMKKAHEVDTSPETPFTGLQRAAEFAFVGAAENAQKEFAPYDAHPDELEGFLRVIYNFGKALAFKANGDYATAVSYAERAKNRDWYQLQYELGDIYLDAGQADDAVSTMEPLLKRYDEERAEFWTFPLLHYRLGIAYQEVGRSEDAITQFETFLRLWKDADPELDQPGDARERLAVLKRGL